MFQLTFLGTSSGMPTKYRNVSGLAIECVNPYLSGDTIKSKKNRPWILVDCGEGTQHQLLKTNLSFNQLSTICITHAHGDHCYGLAGLLSSMAMSGRKTPLKLVAPKAIGTLLDTLTITTQLYFPYDIEFLAIEDILKKDDGVCVVDFSPNHNITINITELSHRLESYAFGLTQTIHRTVLNNQKLLALGIKPSPIWGKLKQGHDVTLVKGDEVDESKGINLGDTLKSSEFVHSESELLKIVISGDNDTPELLNKAVESAVLLVHESTYTQAVADKIESREDGINPQHSTAKQVAKFAEAHTIPYLILMHFSARYQLFDDARKSIDNMGHIREEVEQFCEHYTNKFKQKFWLAEDFDVYEVNFDNENNGVVIQKNVNQDKSND